MLLVKFDDIRDDFNLKNKVAEAMDTGGIFVYPTDTVYGLGCDAMQPTSVRKIRAMKGTDHPFSVIAPSMDWIQENFIIRHPQYMERFPGPVTLILEKKDPDFLKWVSLSDTMGIRIPHHHFTKFIQRNGHPFVTTSVNTSGQPHTHDISEVPESLLSGIDVVVDAGPLRNPPSMIINLTGPRPEILRSNGY